MNFCAGCLDPSVTTNKPEADGKEVTNLISQDPDVRRNGYMGEYFIRPPVDITFEFKVPIDVCHMKLSIKLEQKRSTGFYIFAQPEEANQSKGRSHKQKSTPDVASNRPSVSTSNAVSSSDSLLTNCYSCAPTEMYSVPASTSTSVQPDHNTTVNDPSSSSNVYFCVGKFFTQSEDQLFLKNPHYKHWINIKMPVFDTGVDTLRVYKGFLKHSNRLALRCVKRMIIRISKTVGSAPPVLQNIEIWGQPGISTNKLMRKTCVSKWLDRIHTEAAVPCVPRIYNSEPEEKKRDTSDECDSESKDSFEIPEDFLDPLTCDVMTIPLLLPSGHSIDAHTLERYIANEAMWGRPASDPFTGVPFKSGQMPSSNVPLKARIDRFLVMNADHPMIQTCGRTLATSQFEGGLSKGIIGLTNYGQHINDYSVKRKRESEDVANKKYVAMETNNLLRDESCEVVGKKNVKFPNERTSRAVKDGAGTYSEINSGIKKSLKHKSENMRFNNSAGNNVDSSITERILQNEGDQWRPRASVSHLQIPKQVVGYVRKPSQHVSAQQPSSSHHGLIRMIGSALSHTRHRTDGIKSQDQRSMGKPTSLIQGDAKPKETSVFDLVSKNAASCHCGGKSELYKVPCNHVICRKCLLLQQSDGTEVKCEVCGQLCRKSDVTRYHEKSIFAMD